MEMHVPFLLWAFLFWGVISSSPVPRKLFGEIRSPGYPKPYPNNNISIWDIHVPRGYVVKLTFRYFDLEPSESCFYDYVKIKADKKNLGRYCGQLGSITGNHPGRKKFVSKGNRMHLAFHSDFSNEDNGTVIPYRGFLAYYQAVDLDECDPNNAAEEDERPRCQHVCHNYVGGYFCSCRAGYQLQSDLHSCKVECSSELFTEASGYLSSPEYPQPYPEDLQCNYSIRLQKGLSISLKFLEPFEIDDHQQVRCPYDQLKIQAHGREIGEFCGKESPGSIETNSNEVDILFLTDESGFSRGWKIHYTSKKMRCPQPVPRDQFTIIRDPQPVYQFQDYFIVSCKTGYNLMEGNRKLPSFTAVCQADGTWHQSMPRCEIVNCGNPTDLTNGAFSYVNKPANNSYLSVITYQCNEPYYHIVTGTGGDRFTCSSEGTWVDGDGQVKIPACLPVCGKPVSPVTEVQRILGGKSARTGSFPWQALTHIHGRGGGALLGDRWILTAAHTILPKETARNNVSLDQLAEEADIFLGHTKVEELHKMGNHPVRRIFIHPDYNPNDEHNFNGDIALLELKHPVTLGPMVLPICLPDTSNNTFYAVGHMGYVSGFGVEKNFISNNLKYVSLPAVAREKCQSWLDSKKRDIPIVFSENMFCAGFLTVKRDTCQGDSGSVFTVLDSESGRWVAIGIVSWGIGCAEGYGFYTKILNYVDWIKGIVREDSRSMLLSY
ncbi:complement component 1, r subcomponent [Columba livia]|uniref:complement subcomponent C1r n=1 Tax=Columba livia TaxID=8932 RepID=A0A2I0MLA7_COLLI|nr:complement C1r subcomponent [Columba livia]PKK30456.1 complement component 1, r subcomponent [Columba livia]